MTALKAILKTVDHLPEAQRALYIVGEDGRHYLNGAEYAEYKALGMTPAEISALAEAKRQAPADLEKILEQARSADTAKIALLTKQLDAVRGEMLDAVLVSALARGGANRAGVDIGAAHLADRVKLSITDEGGFTMAIKDRPGVKLDTLVAELRVHAPNLFHRR